MKEDYVISLVKAFISGIASIVLMFTGSDLIRIFVCASIGAITGLTMSVEPKERFKRFIVFICGLSFSFCITGGTAAILSKFTYFEFKEWPGFLAAILAWITTYSLCNPSLIKQFTHAIIRKVGGKK